jgi:DNA-binding response OmpR family regulator
MATRKILIVDDEPYILRILSFKLRLASYQPIEAETGEEAIVKAKSERPDLVLLDVSLPTDLSGFDVCRALKSDPITHQIPIVMLTARGLPADRSLGLKLGAIGYITKPFSTRAVIEKIGEILATPLPDSP